MEAKEVTIYVKVPVTVKLVATKGQIGDFDQEHIDDEIEVIDIDYKSAEEYLEKEIDAITDDEDKMWEAYREEI